TVRGGVIVYHPSIRQRLADRRVNFSPISRLSKNEWCPNRWETCGLVACWAA
ncbi:hypothetical protein Dimus_016407, partial [Dionaea muscipula]